MKSCQWHVHWNHSALQLPVTDLCNFAHRPLHLWTVYNSESGSLQGNSGVLATLGNYVDTRFWVVVCTVDSIRVGYNCLWTRNCLEAPFQACLTVSHLVNCALSSLRVAIGQVTHRKCHRAQYRCCKQPRAPGSYIAGTLTDFRGADRRLGATWTRRSPVLFRSRSPDGRIWVLGSPT